MTHRGIILGAVLATLSAGAANAADRLERVSYRDLDLATAAGQAVLQQRLDAATQRVCRIDVDRHLASPMEKRACYREARKGIDAQMALLSSEIQRGR